MQKQKRAKTAKIKTFWFDLGNVILPFDFTPAFRRLAKYTDKHPELFLQFFRDNAHLEGDCDEGRVHAYQLYRLLKKNFGLDGLKYVEFKRIWNDIFKENLEVSRLLARLRKEGYRLILISNTNKLHFDHIVATYPALGHFHHHVLSYKERCRKPRRGIYEKAMSLSKAKPHEIFYVDDREDLTTAAARNHRVHAHTFTHYKKLHKHLKDFGVL